MGGASVFFRGWCRETVRIRSQTFTIRDPFAHARRYQGGGGIGLPFRQAQGPELVEGLALAATREALINVGRDRLIPPFKRRGGVR
jgi:hypothetical protein